MAVKRVRKASPAELRQLAKDMRESVAQLKRLKKLERPALVDRKDPIMSKEEKKWVAMMRKPDRKAKRSAADERKWIETGEAVADLPDVKKLQTFVRVPIEGSKHPAIIPIPQLESYMKTKAAKKAEKEVKVAKETKKAAKHAKGAKDAPKAAAKKSNGKRAGALEGKIKILAKSNPKRKGTGLWHRWEKMKAGMSVEDANAKGIDSPTLRGWIQQGHISVG